MYWLHDEIRHDGSSPWSDYHVINIVWSDSLNKWVWMDPSFAASVTDENGLLLHPGEVRERLRRDLPVQLNEDANWNHETIQTVDCYLSERRIGVVSGRIEPESFCGRFANRYMYILAYHGTRGG